MCRTRAKRESSKAPSVATIKSAFRPEGTWMMLNMPPRRAASTAASALAYHASPEKAATRRAAWLSSIRTTMSMSLVNLGSPNTIDATEPVVNR